MEYSVVDWDEDLIALEGFHLAVPEAGIMPASQDGAQDRDQFIRDPQLPALCAQKSALMRRIQKTGTPSRSIFPSSYQVV